MSDILCVTNRTLCRDDCLLRLEEIAKCKPAGIILREKDLAEAAYKSLAAQVLDICQQYQVLCILHGFLPVALELKAAAIHLPLAALRQLYPISNLRFPYIGTSCHSVAEALEAEKLGCTYVIAGHIFATDCKKGLAPRGLDFLKEVCASVSLPVYAIGGVDGTRIASIRQAGAAGACCMSSLMTCQDVAAYFKTLQ